jgi:hypothetical protein
MRRLLVLWGVLVLGVAPALAVVTPNSIVTMQTPTRGIVQFLQGTDSAGTYKTVYTAGTNGSKCNALWLTTDDGTATHVVTVQLTNGGVRYGGLAVLTVLSAGFANGVPALNLLAPTLWPGLPLDSDGNPYIQLASGDTLQATFATALTASTRISLVASCGDY